MKQKKTSSDKGRMNINHLEITHLKKSRKSFRESPSRKIDESTSCGREQKLDYKRVLNGVSQRIVMVALHLNERKM